mmetsp:Transcript_25326/g.45660  ORF Transcript_25326/g.45660 Transcript_25326/m.45660 type:complete len:243 (+) Transcript_25326:1613-2341(+)
MRVASLDWSKVMPGLPLTSLKTVMSGRNETVVPDARSLDRRFTRDVLYSSVDESSSSLVEDLPCFLVAVVDCDDFVSVFDFPFPSSSSPNEDMDLESFVWNTIPFQLLSLDADIASLSFLISTSSILPSGRPFPNRIIFLSVGSFFFVPFLRSTLTSTNSLKALTTLIPTPCNPPLTLYPLSCPALSNFPPACRTVNTVSNAEILVVGCKSVGIPRPLSATVHQFLFFPVTLSPLASTCDAS